jgi:predicted transcriptional regulator
MTYKELHIISSMVKGIPSSHYFFAIYIMKKLFDSGIYEVGINQILVMFYNRHYSTVLQTLRELNKNGYILEKCGYRNQRTYVLTFEGFCLIQQILFRL